MKCPIPRRLVALAATAASCVPHGAQATTLVLEAARDTAIFGDSLDCASGAGQLFVGNTAGSQPRRALLWFDLSSVLPGMRVVQASLQILVNKNASGGPESAATLHRLSSSWGEAGSNRRSGNGAGDLAQPGDATWRLRFHGNAASAWKQPGGDYAAQPTATLSFAGTGVYAWSGPGLVADVSAWIAAPQSNHGWIVIGTENDTRTAHRFDSRETGDAFSRPQLRLELTPVAAAAEEDVPLPPWALGMLGIGLAGALSAKGDARRRSPRPGR